MDAGNEVNNVDYVIVLGDTNIGVLAQHTLVCVDVPETATLAELRVEIELAANDIDEIPREFAFLVKGGRFLQRKEASRKVSTVTGNHRVYIEQLGVARSRELQSLQRRDQERQAVQPRKGSPLTTTIHFHQLT